MTPDILCFSHLRWNFVYQRPQHIMSGLSAANRVFYIEEPCYDSRDGYHYHISNAPSPNVYVVVPHLPLGLSPGEEVRAMRHLIDSLMEFQGISTYILWYYSPTMLSFTDHLKSVLTVYDCMDELSAFLFAPADLKAKEATLMLHSDLVFTGGHSLFEAKRNMHRNVFFFPSSIDKDHFSWARKCKNDPDDQRNLSRPRLGFYGVIDERLNVQMLDELSRQRPQWQFVLIGPIVKIDVAILPRRSNIHYLGSKPYPMLPQYLAGWDIAMMPFALNDSTRFISPTKTPEYLAGGKPVICPSIRDVVDSYGALGMVHIADTTGEFIEAAETILKNHGESPEWLQRVDSFLADMSWESTVREMKALMSKAIGARKTHLAEKDKIYV